MALTAEEKYQFWLSYAQIDMDSSKTMLDSARWFYTIFMCQQAIEKLIKGLYVLYIDDDVPRLHDINSILDRFKDKMPHQLPGEYDKLFDTLSQFYLKSRYPDYTSSLSKLTTAESAQSVYKKTKEAYEWFLNMKPRNK